MCRINFWREKERRIIIIIRNGANTISLQTLFGDLINSLINNLLGTTSTSSGTRKAQKIGIGWTNLAAVAIETKKGGFKFFYFENSKSCLHIYS
jgi:hypothetical protein